jgi:hypothetical protein
VSPNLGSIHTDQQARQSRTNFQLQSGRKKHLDVLTHRSNKPKAKKAPQPPLSTTNLISKQSTANYILNKIHQSNTTTTHCSETHHFDLVSKAKSGVHAEIQVIPQISLSALSFLFPNKTSTFVNSNSFKRPWQSLTCPTRITPTLLF